MATSSLADVCLGASLTVSFAGIYLTTFFLYLKVWEKWRRDEIRRPLMEACVHTAPWWQGGESRAAAHLGSVMQTVQEAVIWLELMCCVVFLGEKKKKNRPANHKVKTFLHDWMRLN